ncbi:MAG: DsbA family protein [Chloroflexota bacterium]|nr:DsbA family protein [Chloroflexota bacterium]
MTEPIAFDLYFDYICPYTQAASVWARQLDELLGDQVAITWRAFPIEQVNSPHGPEWLLWEQPEGGLSQGLLAFRAGKAAARQAPAAFNRFHHAMIDLRRISRRTLTRRATLVQLANANGLDVERFERDLDDCALLTEIGEDYATGREQFGVFGTPTLVFPGGGSLYLQMTAAPPIEEAATLLRGLAHMASEQPYILEIKRPA